MIFVVPTQGPKMIRSEHGALTNGTRRAILSPVDSSIHLDPRSEAWNDYEEGSTDTRSVCERRSVGRSVGRTPCWLNEWGRPVAGFRKPGLDISEPSGYTDPLRCLLAAPCPSPGAYLRIRFVDRPRLSWPFGRIRKSLP